MADISIKKRNLTFITALGSVGISIELIEKTLGVTISEITHPFPDSDIDQRLEGLAKITLLIISAKKGAESRLVNHD